MTFGPQRQTLPRTAFGDGWISRSLTRSSPARGLAVCSCSYARAFAPRFFQAGLTASPLRFATVVVTLSGDLLSGHKSWPMLGTLGWGMPHPTICESHQERRNILRHPVTGDTLSYVKGFYDSDGLSSCVVTTPVPALVTQDPMMGYGKC